MQESAMEAPMAVDNPNSTSGSRSSSFLPMKRKFSDAEATIIWPPVVIIENTKTHFDQEQRIWKGLENEEIRNFLKGFKGIQYNRVIALYNRNGNRGKSIVSFPASPSGYMDAQTLCELLEHEKRGRCDWLKVAHLKDPYGSGRIDSDGKRILYGYLANKEDMEDADFGRKLVKRWSEESYIEKVLQPLQQIERDKEEARKKRVELTEETKQRELAVEHNRSEFGKAAAEFKKINAEIQAQKRQEEELEAKHRRAFEERTKQYEKEKLQKLESFKEREKNIRERLQQNNIEKQNAVIQYEELARRLKDGINMEKKKHELRSTEQQQMEMLERMKLDSMLQSEMEQKLALLENKFQDKQLQLQEQQNEQIMKFRAEFSAQKEKFLEGKLKELEKIEKESQEAKTATTETQKEIERECIICFHDIVMEKLERALFGACGHANVCSKCAAEYWKAAVQKKEKPSCPTCKTVQQKKYSLLPAVIYS